MYAQGGSSGVYLCGGGCRGCSPRGLSLTCLYRGRAGGAHEWGGAEGGGVRGQVCNICDVCVVVAVQGEL